MPGDYGGTLVTDRGSSYRAAELSQVKQHQESKRGKAKGFGSRLKSLLQQANQLWRDHRDGKVTDYAAEVARMEQELTHRLRMRRLPDLDNRRLLDGIGLQSEHRPSSEF